MDTEKLKMAIDRLSLKLGSYMDLDDIATVREAAKETLARREAEKPKRLSLDEMIGLLSSIALVSHQYGACQHAADVLRAVQEFVKEWNGPGPESETIAYKFYDKVRDR